MGSLGASLPSFADNESVATLPTINYQLLLNCDEAEMVKLLSVSTREGFFYLDLQDEDVSQTTCGYVDQIYDFMCTWFNQDLDTKLQDLQSNYTDGYGQDQNTHHDETRTSVDLTFVAGISQPDFLLGHTTALATRTKALRYVLSIHHLAGPHLLNPMTDRYHQVSHKGINAPEASVPAIQSERALFEAYLTRANSIARQLLSSLSTASSLPPTERFENWHQTSDDSNSVLVLLRYPYVPPAEQAKTVGHNKHTDIGSITVLFTDQWGLQVMAADSKQWQWVAPRRGCAIINVGDSLRFLSQKKLKSCLHRVVPVDGQASDRYTIAYFLRPDNRASFIDSNGALVTAQHWHDVKYEVFRASQEEQRRDTILTGGLEPVVASGV